MKTHWRLPRGVDELLPPQDLPGPWGRLRREALGQPQLLRGEGPGLAMLRSFSRLQGAS